tara:strand:- start:290 stop:517 length:228 start_codon:yes stop_codon:yes gene_type:complete
VDSDERGAEEMRISSLSLFANRFNFRFKDGNIYKMLAAKDIQTVETENEIGNEHAEVEDGSGTRTRLKKLASRQT